MALLGRAQAPAAGRGPVRSRRASSCCRSCRASSASSPRRPAPSSATSSTGINDRFPLHVLVWPVRVQGETSGAEVAAAVNGFNALARDGAIQRPDLLIVARGGGSLEDLWGFNDEVARPRRRRLRHSGDLRRRPRDRLDADRPRRRRAGADTDGRRRNRRAGEGRPRSDACQSWRAAQGGGPAQFRTQAAGCPCGRPRAALARSIAGAAAPTPRRSDIEARPGPVRQRRPQAGTASRPKADAGHAVAAHQRSPHADRPRPRPRAGGVLRHRARTPRAIFAHRDAAVAGTDRTAPETARRRAGGTRAAAGSGRSRCGSSACADN